MERDRKEICRIISEMLDHPNENGIYPTTKAYDELEKYMEEVRKEVTHVTRFLSIGWAYGDFCSLMDEGKDPRKEAIPGLIERVEKAFEGKKEG